MSTSPPIYIINLKRNPERRLYMQRQMNALGLSYQFIDAIDKVDLKSPQHRSRISRMLGIEKAILENKYAKIINRAKIEEGTNWENASLGKLAVILSHIKVYNLIVKNGIDVVCVLEDDATLLPTFPEVLRIAPKLEWDILLLVSQPSDFPSNVIQKRFIKRIRIFNKDILFFNHRKINNANSSKQKAYRIKYLSKEYGFNSNLYSKQSERIIKILEEHDMKYEEIIKEIVSDKHRLSLVKHERYIRYRILRQYLKVYTSIQLGAIPRKTSLKSITKHHCIAEPRHEPYSATAYLVNQSTAMKWKRNVLVPDALEIDRIPWELHKNMQAKLRIITPPCATPTHSSFKYSSRTG